MCLCVFIFCLSWWSWSIIIALFLKHDSCTADVMGISQIEILACEKSIPARSEHAFRSNFCIHSNYSRRPVYLCSVGGGCCRQLFVWRACFQLVWIPWSFLQLGVTQTTTFHVFWQVKYTHLDWVTLDMVDPKESLGSNVVSTGEDHPGTRTKGIPFFFFNQAQ